MKMSDNETKTRKPPLCSNCNQLGHSKSSTLCPINIENNNKLFKSIKDNILQTDIFDNLNEIIDKLSIELNISNNKCDTLYRDIPMTELLNRPISIEKLKNILDNNTKDCYECKSNIICITDDTMKIWKNNMICDICWIKYTDDINDIWHKVRQYKSMICAICNKEQKHIKERFHYDHLSMFNKGNSICSMVNSGCNLEDIYKEIDKCQIVCVQCHHIITYIEDKIGFTRIKQNLTRRFNTAEITKEEYEKEKEYLNTLYIEKMYNIYELLKSAL